MSRHAEPTTPKKLTDAVVLAAWYPAKPAMHARMRARDGTTIEEGTRVAVVVAPTMVEMPLRYPMQRTHPKLPAADMPHFSSPPEWRQRTTYTRKVTIGVTAAEARRGFRGKNAECFLSRIDATNEAEMSASATISEPIPAYKMGRRSAGIEEFGILLTTRGNTTVVSWRAKLVLDRERERERERGRG